MPTQAAREPVILIIEDYRDSREMLTLLLESVGYRVLPAANGHEALAIAASNQLDLIVTDFGLPDMDGLSVVRSLRKLNERLKTIPCIMLTAIEGDEYCNSALREGCTVLTKPADFERLQVMIGELLSREPRLENHKNAV